MHGIDGGKVDASLSLLLAGFEQGHCLRRQELRHFVAKQPRKRLDPVAGPQHNQLAQGVAKGGRDVCAGIGDQAAHDHPMGLIRQTGPASEFEKGTGAAPIWVPKEFVGAGR